MDNSFCTQLVFFLIVLMAMYFGDSHLSLPLNKPITREALFMKAITYTLILWIIFRLLHTSEGFWFEVTPWKRCPKCPKVGYYGMNVGFERSSDEELMSNCNFQAYQPDQPVQHFEHLQGYRRLGPHSSENMTKPQEPSFTTGETKESFCGCN